VFDKNNLSKIYQNYLRSSLCLNKGKVKGQKKKKIENFNVEEFYPDIGEMACGYKKGPRFQVRRPFQFSI